MAQFYYHEQSLVWNILGLGVNMGLVLDTIIVGIFVVVVVVDGIYLGQWEMSPVSLI